MSLTEKILSIVKLFLNGVEIEFNDKIYAMIDGVIYIKHFFITTDYIKLYLEYEFLPISQDSMELIMEMSNNLSEEYIKYSSFKMDKIHE